MNIGKNIKQMRESLGMEQQELAEKLNISNKTISSWECGRTEPKMGMIELMCGVFNCNKTALIDGIEPQPTEEKRVFHTRSLEYPPEIMEFAIMLAELSETARQSAIQYIKFLHEKEKES